MTNRVLSALACAALSACATMRSKPDVEELKPTIEAFHQRARWKDFRAAADLIVPERRTSYVKARLKTDDERDLFITDYELEDAKLSGDGTAEVVSKMTWYRLPSASAKTTVVVSVFVWREGKWWLESQEDGPFPELAATPRADGGA
ncbi:MAG: hypothetical protein MUC96_01610 [Myxococcaceae bacterium]|jgi:hypothetical protein|nr:hypothetical protein [Myxococcaceae bacterium]